MIQVHNWKKTDLPIYFFMILVALTFLFSSCYLIYKNQDNLFMPLLWSSLLLLLSLGGMIFYPPYQLENQPHKTFFKALGLGTLLVFFMLLLYGLGFYIATILLLVYLYKTENTNTKNDAKKSKKLVHHHFLILLILPLLTYFILEKTLYMELPTGQLWEYEWK